MEVAVSYDTQIDWREGQIYLVNKKAGLCVPLQLSDITLTASVGDIVRVSADFIVASGQCDQTADGEPDGGGISDL